MGSGVLVFTWQLVSTEQTVKKEGKEKNKTAWYQWLTPVILATQEAKVRNSS
jgi:hypothetical protein